MYSFRKSKGLSENGCPEACSVVLRPIILAEEAAGLRYSLEGVKKRRN